MPEADIVKQYNPHDHESRVYQQWESAGVFQPDKQKITQGIQSFTMMLPPPNVTGNLHMGHALQDTIMDVLARYHRMLGEPVLWQPGTDHAAIATNKVIEEQLAAEGKTRGDISREEFQLRTEQWYQKTGAEILNQMKRIGASCDWARTRFTLDDDYYRAVQEAFVRYYQQGFIYRGNRIVNWDPKTQTTVSDLEIDYQVETFPYYYLQYGPFEISTARPETKFGDKYVVVHPEDKRYAKYKHGDSFEVEWINGPITATLIKDEAADPKVGSGAMTITPWHSVIDFEIAQRHNLDLEQIIDLSGRLLPVAGEFASQPINEARPQIVEKLKEKGLLIRVEENYEHNIALNDRGKGVLEPQVMRQWFVDMSKLKAETCAVVEKDLISFIPPRWKKNFLSWMTQVRDWNINRQIWLGHRIPVWWQPGTHGTDKEEGNFVVSLEKPAGDYEQDPDVLDTWFSSALWPLATLGWPEQTADLTNFYPTSVLVTARDIIPLWVSRMIFSGLQLLKNPVYQAKTSEQRIPFHKVFIHPTVLTKEGKRMSKSLGTGIDPLDLIENYGADATRFGLMYQMSYDSQAFKFDEEAIKSARNFANKVWNLNRLLTSLSNQTNPTFADTWITWRVDTVGRQITQLLDQYKIGEAARLLYDLVWNDFADWYVEIYKTSGDSSIAQQAFSDILRLLYPFMPHICEVLWQQHGHDKLLALDVWYESKTISVDTVDRDMQQLQDIVTTIRRVRALLILPPATPLTVYLVDPVLPIAIEKLARAKLISEPEQGMAQFPLLNGSSLYLESQHITEEGITEVKNRLTNNLTELDLLITSHNQALKKMIGKAPTAAINIKQEARDRAVQQHKEIQRNLEQIITAFSGQH